MSLKGRVALFLAVLGAGTTALWSQAPAPAAQRPPQRRQGGFVPGQERPVGDPTVVARGNTVYGISCRGCHGADLRGGDMGGPNLLRSQIALSDRDGEKIVPVIQGSLQSGGMPAIPMSPEDAQAVATYVRSVLATIGGQGKPPTSQEPPTILVGNAGEGQAFFSAKCASCHSVTGDLQGIATKIPDPKTLQNTWIVGGGRTGRFSPAPAAGAPPSRRTVTVTVTPPGGEPVEGRLSRIDDFVVTVELADGTVRSFRRDGNVPKVEVHDPLSAHRALFSVYTDKDIHDVTAYLVTLK